MKVLAFTVEESLNTYIGSLGVQSVPMAPVAPHGPQEGPRAASPRCAGRLPYELSRDGWRLFRPEQVAVIGNARRARFHTDPQQPLGTVRR